MLNDFQKTDENSHKIEIATKQNLKQNKLDRFFKNKALSFSTGLRFHMYSMHLR